MTAFALSRQRIDFSPATRIAIAAAAGAIFALSLYGLLRWLLGLAPATPWVRDIALTIHLVTVIPAMPLGAYLFLTKKGGQRHKMLGKLWLALMFVTAISTVFIRNINHGNFSWIHILTLLPLIAVPQVILSARRRHLDAHRKHVRNLFLGSLIVAGAFTFLPGRTMWQWAFGNPAVVQPTHG